MTEKDIKTVFGQAYQGSEFFDKKILSHILGKCDKSGTTTNYAIGNEDATRANIDNIQDYGEYTTVNGDPIRFFDVTLNDLCNITHARVNIQLVLRKLWKDNYSGMVLVFHYASTSRRADKDTWRFSWVERKTSGTTTTPGKRYTYLCGPAYSCRTIAERFDVLQKTANKTLDSITAAFDVEALSKDFFREYKIFYDDIIQWITGTRFVGDKKAERKDKLLKSSVDLYTLFADRCGKVVYAKDWSTFTEKERTERIEKFIRDWVKKLLGRLVFLQFIQKKRWLGIDERAADWSSGKENFLLEHFNSLPCEKNFLKDELYDILFSSLNRTDDVDCSGVKITKRGGVKYPFLNGGLFDDTDEVRIELPNEFFHNENHCKARNLPKKGYRETEDDFFSTCGILDFFSHYNFTIDENATDDDEMGEVGIDPEMLSKVFENLLEDNKEKGAFYTPKEIVSYMCKESLIAYLNTKVTGFDADMRTFVETVELPQSLQCETENIKAALQNVKICDPAVGSGAFPMGLLNLILKLRLSLDDDSCCDVVDKKYDYYSLVSAIRKAEDGVDEENAAKTEKEKLSRIKCAIKKNIIQNNIYGVDIEKGAVDLARLRFWLNIVVDEERPTPLPNLDFKIMQGNSLLEQYEGIDLTKLATMKIRRKCEVRCDLFGDIDGVENDVLYVPDEYVKFNLQEELDRYFDISEPEEKKTARERIEKYIHCVVCSTLQVQVVEKQQALTRIDQESATLTPRQQKIKARLEAEKQVLDDAVDDLDDVINDKFFLWHTWFADVFASGGFDIVIGNPPYIKEYANKSAFCGFKETSPYYMGKMDIWYGFACYGIDILKTKGHLCFIAQNNWTTSKGARIMRNKIVEDARIKQMVDFNNYMVFDSASIQTMIMLFQRANNLEEYQFDYRVIDNTDNPTKDDMMSLLLKRDDTHVKFLSPVLNRNRYKNKLLTFSEYDDILNKIEDLAGEDCFLNENEITQGIVFPQDVLNKENQGKLGDEFTIGQGIFVVSENEVEAENLERDLLRPYYTTEQIKRYVIENNSDLCVIYTTSEYKKKGKIEDYPNVKRHLDKFARIITSDNKPYGLHRARKEEFFSENTKGKIISLRKCSVRPEFSYTTNPCYVSQTFCVINTERWNHKALLGYLNSKLVQFWLRYRGKMQGENYQVDQEPLINIPILLNEITSTKICEKVDLILSNQSDMAIVESEIDNIVYECANLTNDEIETINVVL